MKFVVRIVTHRFNSELNITTVFQFLKSTRIGCGSLIGSTNAVVLCVNNHRHIVGCLRTNKAVIGTTLCCSRVISNNKHQIVITIVNIRSGEINSFPTLCSTKRTSINLLQIFSHKISFCSKFALIGCGKVDSHIVRFRCKRVFIAIIECQLGNSTGRDFVRGENLLAVVTFVIGINRKYRRTLLVCARNFYHRSSRSGSRVLIINSSHTIPHKEIRSVGLVGAVLDSRSHINSSARAKHSLAHRIRFEFRSFVELDGIGRSTTRIRILALVTDTPNIKPNVLIGIVPTTTAAYVIVIQSRACAGTYPCYISF